MDGAAERDSRKPEVSRYPTPALIAHREFHRPHGRLMVLSVHGQQHEPVAARREILEFHSQRKRHNRIALLYETIERHAARKKYLFVRGFIKDPVTGDNLHRRVGL